MYLNKHIYPVQIKLNNRNKLTLYKINGCSDYVSICFNADMVLKKVMSKLWN